jgi:hypothetical protein
MTYAEAQAEFSIRLYRWAKTALEMEMMEGFPRFQLNKEWSKLRCEFFQTLDPQSKVVFSQGILQMRHQIAAKTLGEVISAEAESLLGREEVFRSENNGWARRGGSTTNPNNQSLATRRELKKAMAAHFRAAFGDDCLPADPLDRKRELRFSMKCRGWIIKTGFEFGRWDPEITCAQDVWTGKLITKEEPQVLFANCLGFQMNYGDEIGIGSGWEGIANDNVEQTCLAVVDHCRRIFDVLPMLLDNLDLQQLSK